MAECRDGSVSFSEHHRGRARIMVVSRTGIDLALWVTFVFRCGYQKLGRLLRTYTRLASCYRNRGSPPCFMTLWAFAATAVPSTIAVANANRIVFRIETSGIGPLSASHTSRLGRTMRPNSDPKSNCVL
jgi:hypothetical protein